jgi:hypothetical protein
MAYHHYHTGFGHRPASRTLLMLSVVLTYTAGPWLTLIDHLQASHAGYHAAPSWVQALQDSTALLPAVGAGVWLGLAIAGRIGRSQGSTGSKRALACSKPPR